jgi:hypothetical protein
MGPVSLSTFAYGRCDLTTANGTKRTNRAGQLMSVVRGSTGSGRRAAKPTRLTHS